MELQKRQNKAICTCLFDDLREHVTLERLHAEMNLLSLEQRRHIQLLKLLFIRRKEPMYVKRGKKKKKKKKPVRNLTGNSRIKFKLMTNCSG